MLLDFFPEGLLPWELRSKSGTPAWVSDCSAAAGRIWVSGVSILCISLVPGEKSPGVQVSSRRCSHGKERNANDCILEITYLEMLQIVSNVVVFRSGSWRGAVGGRVRWCWRKDEEKSWTGTSTYIFSPLVRKNAKGAMQLWRRCSSSPSTDTKFCKGKTTRFTQTTFHPRIIIRGHDRAGLDKDRRLYHWQNISMQAWVSTTVGTRTNNQAVSPTSNLIHAISKQPDPNAFFHTQHRHYITNATKTKTKKLGISIEGIEGRSRRNKKPETSLPHLQRRSKPHTKYRATDAFFHYHQQPPAMFSVDHDSLAEFSDSCRH